MARYYYTDPIAAAYMAREHNFKFESCYGFELRPYNKGWEIYHEAMSADVKYFDSKSYFKHSFDYDAKNIRIYISGNYGEILEPQIGDIVFSNDTAQVVVSNEVWRKYCLKSDELHKHPNDDYRYDGDFEVYTSCAIENVGDEKIILRNGKAWFTPEVECD